MLDSDLFCFFRSDLAWHVVECLSRRSAILEVKTLVLQTRTLNSSNSYCLKQAIQINFLQFSALFMIQAYLDANWENYRSEDKRQNLFELHTATSANRLGNYLCCIGINYIFEVQLLFKQICKISPNLWACPFLCVSVCVCVRVSVCYNREHRPNLSENQKCYKKTFVDFDICHQEASLRKLYFVTLTYF